MFVIQDGDGALTRDEMLTVGEILDSHYTEQDLTEAPHPFPMGLECIALCFQFL